MKIMDVGVLGASFMDFTSPSEFALQALYYCPQFGHFCCDRRYRVRRDCLDLFLLIYICEGSLTIETQGRTFTAREGEVALLDCRRPHCYYCKETVDFLWIHFNGNSSSEYASYLCAQNGIVFSGENIPRLYRVFMDTLECATAEIVNEHRLSLNIHEILSGLADMSQADSSTHSILLPAIAHIRENYAEEITLDQLADLCMISKPHLLRCFKKHLNCTPHEYLLACRLRQAKQLLVGTSLSAERISERCGFNSASHFSRAFRKANGTSPSEFRKLKF